jgi:hypothetical protein
MIDADAYVGNEKDFIAPADRLNAVLLCLAGVAVDPSPRRHSQRERFTDATGTVSRCPLVCPLLGHCRRRSRQLD